MPPSSLEERIRDLCAQAAAAKSQADLSLILPKLQGAIRDHVNYLRAIAVEVIPQAFRRDSDSAD